MSSFLSNGELLIEILKFNTIIPCNTHNFSEINKRVCIFNGDGIYQHFKKIFKNYISHRNTFTDVLISATNI